MNDMVSIILPIYNVKNYLDRCLSGIVSQPYRNIEIILVDDGSTDGSAEICDEWALKDSRIKVLHQNNSGVSVARNRGLEHSNGSAVIFLDADDEIEQNMISDMIGSLFEYHADVVCCGYTNEFKDKILANSPKEGVITGEQCLEAIFHAEIMSAVWNKMFKREVLIKRDGSYVQFPVGICIGEDFVFLTEVLKQCSIVYCINEVYYHWYRRMDSATGDKEEIRIDNRALTELDALERVVEMCRDCSDDVYYTACTRFFGTLMAKLKVSDLRDNSKARDIVCAKMAKIIDQYPKRNLYDYLKILKGKLLLKLISGGIVD